MTFEDKPKEIESEEEISIDEQDDIFYALLRGKNITETVKTSRGRFKIKFPIQKDLITINRLVASMRNGVPCTSFDVDANFMMYKIAFLNIVVIDGENWFVKLKKQYKNETWEEVPDTNFIDEIFVMAYSFRNEIESRIGKNETNPDESVHMEQQGVQEAVVNGLFDGVGSGEKES
ncbi:MAG: hypothetical protein ACRC4W_00160 [Treponemataceae bacterium]